MAFVTHMMASVPILEAGMRSEEEWAQFTKGVLKAEMTRRGVTYDQLTEKLAAIGVQDTSVNIRNKVARGRFTAVFLMQVLTALGVESLHLR